MMRTSLSAANVRPDCFLTQSHGDTEGQSRIPLSSTLSLRVSVPPCENCQTPSYSAEARTQNRHDRSTEFHVHRRRFSRRGAAMVVALVAVAVVALVSLSLMQSLMQMHRQAKVAAQDEQASWLAESALARGAARLHGDDAYVGETWLPASSDPAALLGRAVIRVEPKADNENARTIVVEAFVPDHPQRRVRQARELQITLKSVGENP